MRYFSKFPIVQYDLLKNGSQDLVTNIFKRVKFLEDAKTNASVIFEYTVKDSDKPEIIADKIYGSVEYFWVIFLLNDIINPFDDWVKGTKELENYILKKYGVYDGIHHYEDSDGFVVNQTDIGAVPISIFEHESRINESKRKIKLLDPKYLSKVEQDFKEKISA